MPPVNPPPYHSRHSAYRPAIGVLIIIAVAFVMFFSFNYFYGWFPNLAPSFSGALSVGNAGVVNVSTPKVAPLEGTLFLALEKGGVRGMYRYNLLTKTLEKITNLPASAQGSVAMTADLIGFGFVNTSSSGTSVRIGYSTDSGKTIQYASASTAGPIAGDITGLTFSPDNKSLAYAASSKHSPSLSDWSIYEGQGESQPVKRVVSGFAPAFGSSDQLFFLNGDGLNVADLQNPNASPANLAAVGTTSPNDSLAVSTDGSVLAWENDHHLFLFQITYGNVTSVQLTNVISADSFDALSFDGSGQFLLGKLSSTDDAGNVVAVPAAYDLNGNLAIPITQLTGFDPDSVSVAGWRIVK